MSHDRGMIRDIVMDALMGSSQSRALVSGHADRIRHYPYQYLIILDLRKLKLLEAEVICAVESHCFCFHFLFSFRSA